MENILNSLRDYATQVMNRNPRSMSIVAVDPIPGVDNAILFKFILISFPAKVNGLLKGCRSIIGMDGCHLKTTTGGILLSVISRYCNKQVFSVAYAVVRIENTQSWLWFIKLLLESIGIEIVAGWTFIIDRQKVLLHCLLNFNHFLILSGHF